MIIVAKQNSKATKITLKVTEFKTECSEKSLGDPTALNLLSNQLSNYKIEKALSVHNQVKIIRSSADYFVHLPYYNFAS